MDRSLMVEQHDPITPSRRASFTATAICSAAFVVYVTLGLIAHFSLRTNAFDLSVFDYALWSSVTGEPLGYVPLFQHSLFAQHFMPTRGCPVGC